MIEPRVTWNITDLDELAAKYPGVAHDEVFRVVDLAIRRLEKEVVERTPRGVGGAGGLAGSIAGETVSAGRRVKGVVGTPLEYGVVVEMGRRPGQRMPPVAPIALWAQRKLGVPADEAESVGFAIARKIAVKGFKGARMFEDAWDDTERWVQDMLYSIPERIVKRLQAE